MKRDIIKIDEDLCTGCGLCVPNCHEGALQIIDNKAVLISDLMCDGLGACIGHCPEGAITIEKREAEPYNETKVMEEMISKGKNTVVAHLEHLHEHGEEGFLNEGIKYLQDNEGKAGFDVNSVVAPFLAPSPKAEHQGHGCGCQGSAPQHFVRPQSTEGPVVGEDSALTHWPVQLHLVNPSAPYFRDCDLLVAADCSAFSLGAFHSRFIKGRSVVIGCPKLDEGTDIYVDKLRIMVDSANVNTITVVIMEVPCCGGLLQIVRDAVSSASRKVPVKLVVAGVRGTILKEEWV